MILGKPADVAQLWREKSRGDGLGLRKLDGLFVARNGEGENAVDSSSLVTCQGAKSVWQLLPCGARMFLAYNGGFVAVGPWGLRVFTPRRRCLICRSYQ